MMKDEYITKEQAIEIVEKNQWDWSMAVKELEGLPSADVEPVRRGRWENDKYDFFVCSYCKFPSEAFAAHKLYKYCPNCGAKIEED